MTTAFARRWRHLRLSGLAVAFPAIVAAACAGSQRPGTHRPEPDPCVVIAPPQSPPDSIIVALSSSVDGFVVAQSSVLLGGNCPVRPYGKLAQTWSTERVADGLWWTITLDSSTASSRVRVRSIDATAARDALDGGVDLLLTDDPAIVSYAAHNEQLLTLPLPWDRIYVVLASESAPADVSASLRLTLAASLADAVRADSRITEPPFWWESNSQCSVSVGTRPVPSARASSRVVYLSGDRVAQGIAERLVALAGRRSPRGEDSALVMLLPRMRGEGGGRAAALSPSDFDSALRAGGDLAYVLPLPRFAAAPCQEFAMLMRATPWLKSVIPLIDTRSTAIVRRGRVGLAVDADGSLRLLDGASQKNGKP